MALKALYDEDIVEEDMIIAWYNKPTAGKVLGIPAAAAKAVREAATKFVEWLQVSWANVYLNLVLFHY